MLITQRTGNIQHSIVLLPVTDEKLLIHQLPDKDIHTIFSSDLFPFFQKNAVPITSRLSSGHETLRFLQVAVDNMNSSSVCRIQSGLPIDMLPLDILQHAIAGSGSNYLAAQKTELRRLYVLFHRLMHHEGKRHFLLLSASELHRFAETGQLGPHISNLSALSVRERIVVLEHLMEQMETNPNLDIRFSHEESIFQVCSIFCINSGCMMIYPNGLSFQGTQNDEQHPFCASEINDTELCADFNHYFINTLIPVYALRKPECCTLLRAELMYLRSKL